MKVKDLIAELKTFPEDLDVVALVEFTGSETAELCDISPVLSLGDDRVELNIFSELWSGAKNKSRA